MKTELDMITEITRRLVRAGLQIHGHCSSKEGPVYGGHCGETTNKPSYGGHCS